MSETLIYTVPGMHCGHCKQAVSEEVSSVAGVERVDVDLESKVVTVVGSDLDDATLRARSTRRVTKRRDGRRQRQARA